LPSPARGEGITHPSAPLKRGFIISPPSTGGVGEGAHLGLLQEPQLKIINFKKDRALV